MNTPRQQVSEKLMELLRKMSFQWKTLERGLLDWQKVSPPDQPACFLIKVGENSVDDQAYGVTKYMLHYKIVCYFRADGTNGTTLGTPPEDFYNAALDEIDRIFDSNANQGPQTLGGIVANAWLEGEILIAGGLLDPQIVVMIPVIVMTGN